LSTVPALGVEVTADVALQVPARFDAEHVAVTHRDLPAARLAADLVVEVGVWRSQGSESFRAREDYSSR
jgi:hypothetical protein